MNKLLIASWIARRLDKPEDDIYDVLLGNITKPRSFVKDVMDFADEYKHDYDKGVAKLYE